MKIVAGLAAIAAVGAASVDKLNFKKELQTGRIVGGVDAEVGRFPYMASLQNPGNGHWCGGSLIAPNKILSAAHCAGSTQSAYVGCYNSTNFADEAADDSNDCELIGYEAEIINPDYVSSAFSNDAMIIILSAESKVTQFIKLFAATEGPVIPALAPLTVSGWGRLSSGGPAPEVLQEVEVQHVDEAYCDLQYRILIARDNGVPVSDIPVGAGVDDTMICAAVPGKDSCQGDSGGPLFMRCDATGEDVQVGIVSWGFGCAWTGTPGVYAEVSNPGINAFILEHAPEALITASYEDFCVVDGTQPPAAATEEPTQFPTHIAPSPAPSEWTCNAAYYGSVDGCDCECGIPDPDCILSSFPLYNCAGVEDAICVDGQCVSQGAPTEAPVPSPTEAPVPSPTEAPVPSPTEAPVPAPTDAPAPAPVTLPPTDAPGGLPDMDVSTVLLLVAVALLLVALAVLMKMMMNRRRRRKASEDIKAPRKQDLVNAENLVFSTLN